MNVRTRTGSTRHSSRRRPVLEHRWVSIPAVRERTVRGHFPARLRHRTIRSQGSDQQPCQDKTCAVQIADIAAYDGVVNTESDAPIQGVSVLHRSPQRRVNVQALADARLAWLNNGRGSRNASTYRSRQPDRSPASSRTGLRPLRRRGSGLDRIASKAELFNASHKRECLLLLTSYGLWCNLLTASRAPTLLSKPGRPDVSVPLCWNDCPAQRDERALGRSQRRHVQRHRTGAPSPDQGAMPDVAPCLFSPPAFTILIVPEARQDAALTVAANLLPESGRHNQEFVIVLRSMLENREGGS